MRRDAIWTELVASGSLLILLGCNGAGLGAASGGEVPGGTGGATTAPPSGSSGGASGNVDPTGSTGGSTSASSMVTSDMPCAVASVVKSRCGDCHGGQPKYGAPMSLASAADFRKMTKSGSGTVGQAVVARIHDDAHPMPAAPAERLSASEMASLESWINAGAQAGSCQSPSGSGSGGSTGATTTPTPPPANDPDVTCYNVLAHDPSSKTKPYSVPTTPDLYHCFRFSPPWGSTKVQLVSWEPIIDNDKVIHHWILYNDTGSVADGTDADCSGAHPSAAMVTGWAPGGRGQVLSTDVGQAVDGAGFTLEVHYNNGLGTSSPDASGIKMCVTKKLRKNEAGVHWLGTENISLPAGGKTSGVCTPKATVPITIMSATPHMHLLGRHQTVVINRKGGGTEMLLDKPFEFANQIGYDTPAVIMPGDTLTTTCEYQGAAFYGQGTKQEMCYSFVLAYPNGGLSSTISLLRNNGCTGI